MLRRTFRTDPAALPLPAVPLLRRTRSSPTSTSRRSARLDAGGSGSRRPGGSPSSRPATATITGPRTCCSASTPTSRTTCRSCSPRLGGTRAGRSRKPDHDASNETLSRAYQRVVDAAKRRYDPSMSADQPRRRSRRRRRRPGAGASLARGRLATTRERPAHTPGPRRAPPGRRRHRAERCRLGRPGSPPPRRRGYRASATPTAVPAPRPRCGAGCLTQRLRPARHSG